MKVHSLVITSRQRSLLQRVEMTVVPSLNESHLAAVPVWTAPFVIHFRLSSAFFGNSFALDFVLLFTVAKAFIAR